MTNFRSILTFASCVVGTCNIVRRVPPPLSHPTPPRPLPLAIRVSNSGVERAIRGGDHHSSVELSVRADAEPSGRSAGGGKRVHPEAVRDQRRLQLSHVGGFARISLDYSITSYFYKSRNMYLLWYHTILGHISCYIMLVIVPGIYTHYCCIPYIVLVASLTSFVIFQKALGVLLFSKRLSLRGGLVLWYSPGSLTRRKIWDTAGYTRVSHAFEGLLKSCQPWPVSHNSSLIVF